VVGCVNCKIVRHTLILGTIAQAVKDKTLWSGNPTKQSEPILPSACARDLVPSPSCRTWQKVRSGPKKQTNTGEQDNAGEHSQELQTQRCVQERHQGTKQNQLRGDAHQLALKASTLRMMSWSENISHSAFISAISAGLASLAPMARVMVV